MPLDNNRLVVRCCYLAMIIQAMVINLTPLLFIPLKEQMGLTYEQIGRLILINFLTQMLVDIVCCVLADRVNARPLMVAANFLSGIGLWVFALSPAYFDSPYTGLVLGTVVFSIGCGLLEVMTSPIINAVPSERKAGDMALLHAFYPIGKVTVILITALALYGFGVSHWRWIVLAWTILPFANTLGFYSAKLPPFVAEGRRHTLRELVRIRSYLVLVVVITLAGATEVTLGQWTSAFAQKGLGCSKLTADLAGFCLFGIGMIAGRLWFGFRGEKMELKGLLLASGLLSTGIYLAMSLSPWPLLSLALSAPAGLFVSMLWPGTVSLSAARFPLAGASMFAFLAAGGDTGAALMPWGVGAIADHAAAMPFLRGLFPAGLPADQLGLRAGLLAGMLCPLAMTAVLFLLPKQEKA